MSRVFDRVEILHRLRAVQEGGTTRYERELEADLDALREAVELDPTPGCNCDTCCAIRFAAASSSP